MPPNRRSPREDPPYPSCLARWAARPGLCRHYRSARRVRPADRPVPGRDPAGAERSREAPAPGQADGVRHRRRPAHSRGRHDDGPEVPLGPHVSARWHDARDRAHRPVANHPQRHTRPAAGTRRTRGVLRRRVWLAWRSARLHGDRTPSEVRGKQVRLPLVHEATRREAPHGGHRAWKVRRQGAHRGEGHLRARPGRHVANGLRPRRHALRHDDRWESEGSELPAESRRPGRQSAPPPRRWQHPARQPVRGEGGCQARGLYGRTPQPARTRLAPRHRSDVVQRKRAERRRRDQHPEARRQLRLAARELRPHLSGTLAE